MNKSDLVAKHIETLRTMNVAELTQFGKDNGCDSAAGFAAFKRALWAAGINYDAMKSESRNERVLRLAESVTHTLTLYSDAKAREHRFGITDASGNPVWFGKFFDSDRDYNGEQSTGEMAAAKKAVWFASKVAEAVNGTVALTLNVDAQWLCYANNVAEGSDGGGKARALGEAAIKLGVVLNVQWVPGTENPADQYTICHGYKNWRDNDLAALAEPATVGA